MIIRFVNFLKVAFVIVLREAFGHPATPEKYRWKPGFQGRPNPESGIEIFRHYPAVIEKYPSLIIKASDGDARLTYFNKERLEERNEGEEFKYLQQIIPDNGKLFIDHIDSSKEIKIFESGFYKFERLNQGEPQPNQFKVDDATENIIFNLADKGKSIEISGWKLHHWLIYGGKLTLDLRIEVLSLSPKEEEEVTDLVIIYIRHIFRDLFLQNGIIYTDIKTTGEKERTLPDGRIEFSNEISIPCYSEYENKIDAGIYKLIKGFNLKDAIGEFEKNENL